MGLLSDKISIVTGASSGIGRAVARALAAEGSHVFITGRSAGRLRQAADDIARSVLFAVTQPYDLSVSEIVVGPRKTFPNHV